MKTFYYINLDFILGNGESGVHLNYQYIYIQFSLTECVFEKQADISTHGKISLEWSLIFKGCRSEVDLCIEIELYISGPIVWHMIEYGENGNFLFR